MSAAEKKKPVSASEYRIPAGSSWAGAWKIAAGVGALGLVGAAAGWSTDAHRFAFSYLFAFFLVLTIAFGSMFFILVERLCAASWSVSVRRTAEFFASATPVFVLLFAPVVVCMPTLYPWLHAGGEQGIEATAHAQEPPAPNHGATPPGAAPPGAVPPGPAPLGRPIPPPFGAAPGTPGAHGGIPPGMHAPERGRPGAAATAEKKEGAAEAEEAEIVAAKRPWLNKVGWILRAALYFFVWSWIGLTFFRLSTSQDGTKDPKLTVRAQSLAPAATLLFAFTLTGAAFDWLMSLLPTWYSTIYGVTIFAGSVVAMYATLILVTMSLREAGLLKDAVNVEHFHDLGKLLFGFLVFWAYVSFAQFMLIWYAGIPEEITFYHHRWEVGPWTAVSLAIVLLHFVVPFFLLISHNVKRRPWALRIGALWLIAMHVVEMYWQVLPYYGHGEVAIHWMDVACLLGVGGTYLAVVFYRMTKYPLIPVGDPRLSRSLAFENA